MEPTQLQPQPPLPPQQPLVQPPVPTPPQLNGVPTPPSLPPKSSKAKTAAAVITIIYGSFNIIVGLASLGVHELTGTLILAVSIVWIILAVKALSSTGEHAVTLLRVITIIAMVYGGILLIASFGIPGFTLSGALLPVLFAIVISMLSNKFSVSLRV